MVTLKILGTTVLLLFVLRGIMWFLVNSISHEYIPFWKNE